MDYWITNYNKIQVWHKMIGVSNQIRAGANMDQNTRGQLYKIEQELNKKKNNSTGNNRIMMTDNTAVERNCKLEKCDQTNYTQHIARAQIASQNLHPSQMSTKCLC